MFHTLSMPLILRVGLIVIAVVTVVVIRSVNFMPLSIDCRQTVNWPGSAPHGAIWERETVHWDHVPDGYTTLVGWVNAATAVPCADDAVVTPRIDIRRLRIIASDATGRESVALDISPHQTDFFIGRFFPRIPRWFGETKGEEVAGIASTSEGQLSLDLGRAPLRVYHAWTRPRISLDPALTYRLEVEANISATARLQFGIDYWRDMESDYTGWDPTCTTSANCEGWVSDWYGDTHGTFQTLRAPTTL